MKPLRITLIMAITAICISCKNDKNTGQAAQQSTVLKSDILIETTMERPFSHPGQADTFKIIVSGKSILKGTAILKITNFRGEEIHCDSFPAQKLIHPDYKTANSTLKEAHIRETIRSFFEDDQYLKYIKISS